MRVYFYQLLDPVTKEACYIGMTEDPERRLRQHCSRPGNFKGTAQRTLWIMSLANRGLKPIMEVIEEGDYVDDYRCDPGRRERQLIDEFWQEGHPLLNGWLKRRKCYRSQWAERMNGARWNQQRHCFLAFGSMIKSFI